MTTSLSKQASTVCVAVGPPTENPHAQIEAETNACKLWRERLQSARCCRAAIPPTGRAPADNNNNNKAASSRTQRAAQLLLLVSRKQTTGRNVDEPEMLLTTDKQTRTFIFSPQRPLTIKLFIVLCCLAKRIINAAL